MIAQLSDGSLVEVDTPADATALAVGGLVLDALYQDGDVVAIPVALVARMNTERGPGTGHTARNATVDLIMDSIPGRRK